MAGRRSRHHRERGQQEPGHGGGECRGWVRPQCGWRDTVNHRIGERGWPSISAYRALHILCFGF